MKDLNKELKKKNKKKKLLTIEKKRLNSIKKLLIDENHTLTTCIEGGREKAIKRKFSLVKSQTLRYDFLT